MHINNAPQRTCRSHSPQVVTAIQEYAFKRGFKKDANQRVVEALRVCFGIDINVRDEEYRLSSTLLDVDCRFHGKCSPRAIRRIVHVIVFCADIHVFSKFSRHVVLSGEKNV